MTLTSNDLTKVKGIVKEEVHAQEKRLEKMIDEKLEEKLDEKLTQLKSDFYEKIDPILKEVVDAREDRAITNHRLSQLEDLHPDGKHTFAQ